MTTSEKMAHPCSCTYKESAGHAYRMLDLHCDRHGIWPDGDYCGQCDTDMHRCGGCGETLTHWESMCDDCQAELARESGISLNGTGPDHTDPENPHPEVP